MKKNYKIEIPLEEDMTYEAPQVVTSEYKDLKKQLNLALATLSSHEERIVRLLFLEGADVSEIAEDFGLTRIRIYQIRDKALLKLAHPSRSKYIREFI